MISEDKYSELIRIDNSGITKKLFDAYKALAFLQNNGNTIKADDFSMACLLEISPKQVQKIKRILYENGFINYNTEAKISIIKENKIIADLTSVEIL